MMQVTTKAMISVCNFSSIVAAYGLASAICLQRSSSAECRLDLFQIPGSVLTMLMAGAVEKPSD